ncbi:MAG: hypothetical protein Q4G68_13000 [Planctomycetia bacterium]|nr:hypothetical protein [Planctomycetia bacterium]
MSEREAERTTNDLLAGQISRTEREIKRVDLFAMTAQLAACSVAILFFGILTDHYVFRAGMSTAGRLGFFLALCTACLVIVLRRAVPLLRRRVNPRYAAKVLEGPQGNRTNAIINWLDLCLRHEEASVPDSPLRRKVLDQVAYQAAVEVRELPDETIVDHSSVIRWTIIFACMMGLFLVYTLFASKSPVRSLRRILCPTASIAAPQEVRFLRISPGNVTLFPDSKLQVEAEIAGVGSREVAFCYSTRDARLVDQTVPMTHVGGNIWSLEFPSSSGALLEPLDYEIIVGRQGRKDNRSATFQLNVRSAITFATEKVVVVPPAYTGREAEVHEDSGDIRALYGSQVTLRARANTPLAKALFLPGKQENRAKVMTLDPEQPSLATFEFSVVWDVNNRIGNEPVFPGMDSYQLTCSDAEGNRNRNDATGRVEILRDEAPIVEWVRAAEGVADVPVNQKLGFSVLAVDPDFGLANVTGHILLREEQGVVSAPQPEITFPLLPLTPPRAGALVSITGEQTLNGAILPDSFQLVVGQHYEYWVTASDNALPEPNTAQTGKKLFRVLPPDENPTETPPDEATPTEKDGDEKGGDEKGGDEKGEAGQEKGSETSGDGSDAGEDGQSSEGKDTGEDGQTQEGQPSEEESEGFASSQNAAGEGSEGEPSSGQQESGAGEESASEGASTSESSSQSGQSGQEGQSGQKGKSEPTEQSTSGPGEPSNEGGQSSADKSETPAEPGDTQNSDGGLGSESDGDALNDGDASQGQGQPGQGQPGQ